MTKKMPAKTAAPLLIILSLALICTAFPASADDAELLKKLPGEWSVTDTVEKEGEEPLEVTAVMDLKKDGGLTLTVKNGDGDTLYTYEGTWSSSLVEGGSDRLILDLNATDHPLYEGQEYHVICDYGIYAEGWMEEGALRTFMVLEMPVCDGVSPFEDIFGWPEVALDRDFGPNMRIVNCKEYVSLRKDRSTSSARLKKVPLGAEVFAFPDFGDEKGFILCNYDGTAGYILKEYLEPIE